MTLLVGMIGSDGVVVAADQLFAEFAQDESQVDNFMHSTKLQLFTRQKLLCGYAGDDWASYVGEEISDALRDRVVSSSEIGVLLKSSAEAGMHRVYKSVQNPRSIKDATRDVLVAIYEGEPTLWRIRIRSWEDSTTTEDRHLVGVFPVYGKTVLGAIGNTARYFSHYYRQEMSVEMLTVLAAQIILSGNEVDHMIDGLDVAVLSKGECHILSLEEKRRLRERSQKIDKLIRSQLFGGHETLR